MKKRYEWMKIKDRQEYLSQINKYEKKIYSQNGEDGVIEYLFDHIGFTNRKFVEFGFCPHECNSRNLIENNNFSGLFIDGDKSICEKAKEFFKDHKDVYVECKFITKENINKIIKKHLCGSIDFLSIDVDGIDLYLLQEIDVINPRLICIEFCASLGPEISATVEYDQHFDRHEKHRSGFYCNASLRATTLVANLKNYHLVGVVNGLNAFYIRKDIKLNGIEILDDKKAWMPHTGRTYRNRISLKRQYYKIISLAWVSVSSSGIESNKLIQNEVNPLFKKLEDLIKKVAKLFNR